MNQDNLFVKAAGASILLSFLISMGTALTPSIPTIALSSPIFLTIYTGLFFVTKKSEEMGRMDKIILSAIILLSIIPIQLGLVLL